MLLFFSAKCEKTFGMGDLEHIPKINSQSYPQILWTKLFYFLVSRACRRRRLTLKFDA